MIGVIVFYIKMRVSDWCACVLHQDESKGLV